MSWCNIKALSIFLSLVESLFKHPCLLLIWKHLPHVGGRVKQGILLPQYLELFLDSHFIFTLWDVLSGEFGKELNSGVQLNDFSMCKHCSLHLTLKSVLALQVTYSFSHLLVWGDRILRCLSWAHPSSGTNVDTFPLLFQCSLKVFSTFRKKFLN